MKYQVSSPLPIQYFTQSMETIKWKIDDNPDVIISINEYLEDKHILILFDDISWTVFDNCIFVLSVTKIKSNTPNFLIPKYRATEEYYQKLVHIINNCYRCVHADNKDICIKIESSVSKYCWEDIHTWGDYNFAICLKKAFEKAGKSTIVIPYPYWYKKFTRKYKNVIVLRGHHIHKNVFAQNCILWNLYAPASLQKDYCEKFRHVFVCSEIHKNLLKKNGVKSSVLEQCTDTDIYNADFVEKENNNILFIGNKRDRKCVKYLESHSNREMYGIGYSDKFIDYLELKYYYRNAKIVVNDHLKDMRQYGYLSNKCYDILASGGILLIDDVKGVDLPNLYKFKSRDDFDKIVKSYIKREPFDASKHTFDERVKHIIKYIK